MTDQQLSDFFPPEDLWYICEFCKFSFYTEKPEEKLCDTCKEILEIPTEELWKKLVRCPYCHGVESLMDESIYRREPLCEFCNGLSLVTMSKKMAHVRRFKTMDQIEKELFWKYHPSMSDEYFSPYHDISVLKSSLIEKIKNYKEELGDK